MVSVHAWVEEISVLFWVGKPTPLVQNDKLDQQMVLHRDHLGKKNTIQLARSVRDQWSQRANQTHFIHISK